MKRFLIGFMLFWSAWGWGQKSGIVEYQYIYTPQFMDTVSSHIRKKASYYVDKAAEYAQQHKYILKFNPDESYYYVEPAMAADEVEDPVAYHFSLMIMGHGVFYQNRPEHIQLNQKESGGQLFLIRDSIRNDWTITYESKNIGGFKCYKATKKCPCGKDIVAWFTPEIPVPFGPAGYNGTPGLILELHYFKHTLRAKRIKLLNKKLSLPRPHEGKPVTLAQYKQLMREERQRLIRQSLQH
jgi:GLPGLI family protein